MSTLRLQRSSQRLLAALVGVLALTIPLAQARPTSTLSSAPTSTARSGAPGIGAEVRSHVSDLTLLHLANARAHTEGAIQAQAGAPERAALPQRGLGIAEPGSQAAELLLAAHPLSNTARGPPAI